MMTCSHGLTEHVNCTDPQPSVVAAPAAVSIGPPCQNCGVEVVMSAALLAQLPEGAPVVHPPGRCPTPQLKGVEADQAVELTPPRPPERQFECEVLLVEKTDGGDEEVAGYTIEVTAPSFVKAMEELSAEMTRRWAGVMASAPIVDGTSPQMPAERDAAQALAQMSPAMQRVQMTATQPRLIIPDL